MTADLFTKDRGHLARMNACGDESALRGRIALPFKAWSGTLQRRPGTGCPSYDEEVSRKMQDTASGTLALPF